jgi:methyl-accepting chemotaxis protein
VSIAERSGKLIADLVPDIQRTSELVQEIGRSSREQSTGTELLNEAIQDLNRVVQRNAAAAEQMAATATALSAGAEALQGTVAFFRVGADGEASSAAMPLPLAGQAPVGARGEGALRRIAG